MKTESQLSYTPYITSTSTRSTMPESPADAYTTSLTGPTATRSTTMHSTMTSSTTTRSNTTPSTAMRSTTKSVPWLILRRAMRALFRRSSTTPSTATGSTTQGHPVATTTSLPDNHLHHDVLYGE
ncbi:hypothetical protein BC936DRAFT_137182 [Jimgerdemannia flammicorona]|uniref:Uncharacterized protein n=1 Tax=Jimgerdemannia flammicorona TaxID=994334 RepID=A0A433CXZ4_9FUNG|nr:hypothetical protein BC936DRAFT_137182 [Jimgerdemannia flammicorona]